MSQTSVMLKLGAPRRCYNATNTSLTQCGNVPNLVCRESNSAEMRIKNSASSFFECDVWSCVAPDEGTGRIKPRVRNNEDQMESGHDSQVTHSFAAALGKSGRPIYLIVVWDFAPLLSGCFTADSPKTNERDQLHWPSKEYGFDLLRIISFRA